MRQYWIFVLINKITQLLILTYIWIITVKYDQKQLIIPTIFSTLKKNVPVSSTQTPLFQSSHPCKTPQGPQYTSSFHQISSKQLYHFQGPSFILHIFAHSLRFFIRHSNSNNIIWIFKCSLYFYFVALNISKTINLKQYLTNKLVILKALINITQLSINIINRYSYFST